MTDHRSDEAPRSVRPRPTRTVVSIAVFLLGAVIGQPVASSPGQSPVDRIALRRALSDARARWVARRPAAYEFVLSIPEAQYWWSRKFASYRVASGSSTTLAPPAGRLAAVFRGRDSIDALFDLTAERLEVASEPVSIRYDDELGYPTDAFLGEISFNVPTFRTFSRSTDVAEPFVLLQHLNHCGFVMPNPTALGPCPDYSIAMWGDGTVVYVGNSGVRTIGRRQHQAGEDAVRSLGRALENNGFSRFDTDYSRKDGVSVDHSAERWLTIRLNGQQKTVHDFYGAPDALRGLESSIDGIADSRRYTGLERSAALNPAWRSR